MSQSTRRQFVLTAGVLLAMRPLAFAQQGPRVWRVGFIEAGSRSAFHDEFPKGMRELGYEVGKNLVIEWRFGDGHYDGLPALAADLVHRNVDVIVVSSTPSAQAVKRATSTVPVVMALVGDPVASGFVSSLARPGGNVTGLSLATTDTSSKWLELARTVAPESQIGVLADSNQQTAPWHLKNIERAAQKLGTKVSVAYAPTGNDIESAFDSLAKQRVATVIVLPSGMFAAHATRMAQIALKRRVAAIGTTSIYAQRGFLLGYGQSYGAFVRRTAIYVDKIFKGVKPSELPVEQPIIFELTINLATAKKLGLTIPKELLLRADTVIE